MIKNKVDVIIYCDYHGVPIWSEPMITSRIHAVGENIINNSIEYAVRRVAVLGNLQIVNFEIETFPALKEKK